MSMLDSFFNKGFKGTKCKTLLKLTIPRIKLLRNRREIQLKQMRKDIAKLLENGQEATARIRVEHIIREENMMAAQEILELFCELIAVRLPIIETQRECPIDLKEAISSICFAAPRCADLPELQQVQMLFAAKYGKEFVTAATELLPDCGVNRQVIELLSIRAPSVEGKLKLLKEIAEEHEIDWDPSATETELLKPHEDLLSGPNHFTNGSTLPLPPEKNDALSSDHVDESHLEPASDSDSDYLDLPEVPKDSVRAVSDVPSASGNVSNLPSSAHDLGLDDNDVTKSIPNEDMPHVPSLEPNLEPSVSSSHNHPNIAAAENKQFVPFVSPPSFTSFSVDAKQNELVPPSLSSISDSLKPSQPALSPSSSSISQWPKQSEPALSPPSLSSFPEYGDQNEPASSPSLFSSVSSSAKHSEPLTSAVSPASLPANKNELVSTLSRTKSDINVDLQDVLAAAQSAAETAEHAARAARAAAYLAQVRITDLVTKRSNETSESCGNELHGEGPAQRSNSAKPTFNQQCSFGSNENSTAYGQEWKLDSPTHTSEVPLSHVPQRLPSIEDDPYFSYPNLFTSKDLDLD